MKIISYEVLLRNLCALMGLLREELQPTDEQNYRMLINNALRYSWERFNWRDLRCIEQRTPDNTGFIPYVAEATTSIGTIFNIWAEDPRTSQSSMTFGHYNTPDGTYVSGNSGGGAVWVDFRPDAPFLDGAEYDDVETYNIGDKVYFSNGTDGWFFECLQDETTAIEPVPPFKNYPQADSYWKVIPIPHILSTYIAYAAFAQWLFSSKRNEEADAIDNKAMEFLYAESLKQERQENQQQEMLIRNHRNQQARPPVF